jgi:hypothetical protein
MEGKFGARTNHGDLVIADALALKMMRLVALPMKKVEEENIPQFGSMAWRVQYHEELDRQRQSDSEWY